LNMQARSLYVHLFMA